MGTLSGGNGGDRPSDGGNQPDRLSGLPPEWGTIVIPDNAAELAEEAAEVRRELRRSTRQDRWRRRLRLRPRRHRPESSLRLPLVIMAIAVVATLASLFAVAWPKPQRTSFPTQRLTGAIGEVTLTDANGATVRLKDMLPAVVVLVEGCECAALLADAAGAAGGVAVLAVARRAPAIPPSPNAAEPSKASPGAPAGTSPGGAPTRSHIRALGDPTNALRNRLALPAPTGTPAVALVARTGEVIRLVPQVHSVADFQKDLPRLR